jgi:3-phytase
VEYGLILNGKQVDIAVATERETNKLRIFRLPEMKAVDNGGIEVFTGEKERGPMGISLYKRPKDGAVYAIVSRKAGPTDGYLWQYLLQDDGIGGVKGTKVREFGIYSGKKEIESIAVDDKLGYVYYSDEQSCIRKYLADPDLPNAGKQLGTISTAGYLEDSEGISIYEIDDATGYILISDQSANKFHIYKREGEPGDPHNHKEVKVVDVSTNNSDGSEVTSVSLGPKYPNGFFVAMSDDRTFQYYSWTDIAGKDLAVARRQSVGLQQKHPPVPPDDATKPMLVWDVAAADREGLPRNLRTTGDPLKPKDGKAPSTLGLAELRASGSAEFTEANLNALLKKLHGLVTVFDLRQEDHIFVNGEPISWYATNNWANVGKSNESIAASEAAHVMACKPGTVLALNDSKSKKGGEAAAPIENVTVSRVGTEREIVAAAGASYVRITVSDHSRPLDSEVDRFIFAVRSLPSDAWAHFHCRAGKGRTTTFLALYDMLRNASRVSLEDIVQRQSLLIGDYDLLAPDADAAKAGVAGDRSEFVRAFYQYAQANPDGKPQLWSGWLKAPR